MAINFGDVLSFTAGVAEKDMQYMQEKRNADFNLAMEEFKDNKALVTKLAENRYSRDVNKYDDEVKKYDAVKSVYSAISNDKLSPFDAAYRLASVNDPNWGKYDKDERIAIAKKNSEGFDYTYYTEEDRLKGLLPEGKNIGDKKSFSVQHDKLEITEPTADKYFLDSSYWKGKGPNLDNFKGESILTGQIQKLLGKTDSDGNAEQVDMSNYISDLEKLKTQDIKSIIGKETYSSNNVSDSVLAISEGNYAFGDGTSKSIPSALSSKYATYSGVATNDVRKSIIAPMNAMKIKDIDKFFTSKENGEVVILPGGTSAYIDGRELYNDVVNKLYYNIVYSNGQFKLVASTYASPSVTLNESHLRGGLQINTRVSKKEIFNAVKGLYTEPANDYQPTNYPILTNSTFQSEDNSERIYADFDFPFTSSSHTCQRLSTIQLLKARQQISFSASFNMEAFQLNVGDTVYITNARMGFNNKTFQVVDWNFAINPSDGSLNIDCEFRETASAVYDFTNSNYSTISSGKATNLPNATSVSAPQAITLTDELVQYNDGTVIVKLVIELTAATDNFTEQYEIEIKQLTDGDGNSVTDDFKLIGRGARTSFEFLNVIDQAQYQVRARGVNIYGVKSSSITANRTIIGLVAPPSDVENFSCNIVGDDAHLSWNPVPDLDLAFYVVNFSTATSGAEWSNSVPLIEKISRPGTSVTVPARVGSYLIKAVDKLGGFSSNETVIATDIAAIGNFNAVTTSTQNPAFSGDKTNVVRTTDDGSNFFLTLDSVEQFDSASGNFDSATSHNFDGGTLDNNVASSGTYLFSDLPIDIGAAFTARITASITQTSTDRDRLFDNISGDFDDQLSNFDGDAPVNCRSILQVSTSDDNSTYTAFRNFSVGDYTARYYKFQLLMQSDDGGATPLVSALVVQVDMEDRIISESNVASGTSTKTVTFPITYKIVPAIGVTAQNMTTGEVYTITNKSTTGFQIAFTNSGGSGVSRTFDYIAKGFWDW